MDSIHLINLCFRIFNKTPRPEQATPVFIPVTSVRIFDHINASRMNALIKQLKRSNHVTINMTAIIKHNIYPRIPGQDLLHHCRVVLATDKYLD